MRVSTWTLTGFILLAGLLLTDAHRLRDIAHLFLLRLLKFQVRNDVKFVQVSLIKLSLKGVYFSQINQMGHPGVVLINSEQDGIKGTDTVKTFSVRPSSL